MLLAVLSGAVIAIICFVAGYNIVGPFVKTQNQTL